MVKATKVEAVKGPLANLPSELAFFRDMKALTKTEAASLKAGLVKALDKIFELADEGISATNKARKKATIWSNMDNDDLNTVADALIGAGLNSAPAAVAVRGIVSAYNKLELGLILLPRFIQMYQFYAQYGFMLPFIGGFGDSASHRPTQAGYVPNPA